MSKHVTFFIGNGFDVNVGLKTRYTDFYKVYTVEKSSDSNVIRKFKKEILKSEAHGWNNWMDFEVGMGKQSKHFDGDTPVEDFIECFNDFAICFNKYLIEECNKINWDAVDTNIYNNFTSSVRQFYKHIKSYPSKSIQEMIQHKQNYQSRIHVVQFNYTNVFDELIERSNLPNLLEGLRATGREFNMLGHNLHVHGKMNSGYPSIGVNDKLQIENPTIGADPRIHKIFIKPKFLDALQKRNANRHIDRKYALDAINESTLICAFGASMGDSDKYWWEKIGAWLKTTKGILVVFDICGSMDDGISPLSFISSEMSIEERKKEVIDRFARLSDIGPNWPDNNPNRILVELDTQMFSFKLPQKSIT